MGIKILVGNNVSWAPTLNASINAIGIAFEFGDKAPAKTGSYVTVPSTFTPSKQLNFPDTEAGVRILDFPSQHGMLEP